MGAFNWEFIVSNALKIYFLLFIGSEKCIVSTIAKEISMLQKEQKSAAALLNVTVNSKDFR